MNLTIEMNWNIWVISIFTFYVQATTDYWDVDYDGRYNKVRELVLPKTFKLDLYW